MARRNKVAVVKPELKTFRVIHASVKDRVGPHQVYEQGGERVVLISDQQAKFYVEGGVIEPVL